MKNKIRISPIKNKIFKLILIAFVILIFIICLIGLGINTDTLTGSIGQAGSTIAKFFTLDLSVLPTVLESMLTSVFIAFSALTISVVISLPISFIAATNLSFNNWLSSIIKAFVALLRSVPTLVWGLMIVASLGFGNVGGVLTLVLILNCFLIRSFTGSIEALGDDIIEALKATGAPWIVIAIKGVLPMAFSSMTAWVAIGFEMAIVASISLGIIGVEGVGKVLTSYLGQYEYGKVAVGVLVIFISMYFIEMSTVKIKSTLKKEA